MHLAIAPFLLLIVVQMAAGDPQPDPRHQWPDQSASAAAAAAAAAKQASTGQSPATKAASNKAAAAAAAAATAAIAAERRNREAGTADAATEAADDALASGQQAAGPGGSAAAAIATSKDPNGDMLITATVTVSEDIGDDANDGGTQYGGDKTATPWSSWKMPSREECRRSHHRNRRPKEVEYDPSTDWGNYCKSRH